MSNCKARNLNGFTDTEILNLTIQKSLFLESNGDLQSWEVYEDSVSSSLKFDRTTPSGDTTLLELDTSGILTVPGGLLGGDLDMNDNDILNVDAITGNSGTSILTINDNLTINGNSTMNGTLTMTDQINMGGELIGFNGGAGSNYIQGNIGNTGRMGIITTDTERLTISTGGNIGIGSTTPGTDLQVKKSTDGDDVEIEINNQSNTASSDAKLLIRTGGNSGGNPHIDLDVFSVGGWSIGLDNSDGDKLKFDYGVPAIVGGSTAFTIRKDTRAVGIATDTPAYPLDVLGVINTSSTYNVGGTEVLSSSALGIGVINSSITSNTGNLTNTGDIILASGDLDVNTNAITFDGGLGNGKIQSSGTNLSLYDTNGAEIVRLTNTDTLEVIGDTTIYGDLNLITGGYEILNVPVLSSTTLGAGILNSSITSNTGNLNNIGTINLDDKLTITGTITNASIEIVSTTNKQSFIDFTEGVVDFNGRILYDNLSNFMSIYTNVTEKMRIDSSGNVGIGTATPLEKLHIYGNILLEGSSVTSPAQKPYILFDEAGFDDRFFIGCDLSGAGDANKLHIGANADGGAPDDGDAKITLLQGGNVGIGTVAPDTYLSVNGTINSTGNIPGINLKAVSSDKHFAVGQDDTHNVFLKWNYNATVGSAYGALSCYGGNNDLVLQEGSGNMGIDETAPVQKLDVNGSIRADSFNLGSFHTVNVQGGHFSWNKNPTGAMNGSIEILNNKGGGTGGILFGEIGTDNVVDNYFMTMRSSTNNIGIGVIAPATSAKLEIASTTGALLLPRMTTTQKNALTAVNGMIVYDSTLGKFSGYEGGAWANLI